MRDDGLVLENARQRFGMPDTRLDYSEKLGEPVYPPPARDINN
jgi:hypothetical protein